MTILSPDTSIELLFEDTKGLVDALKARPNRRVKYNPQPRATLSNSRWIEIGSRLPIKEIRDVLKETLSRYNQLQYFSVSNDFYRCEFYREFEIGIGIGNKGAKDRGLAPIKADEMLNALESLGSTEQLIAFVRSRYQGEFNSFEIDFIPVTSYYSATVGAVAPPLTSLGKISGSEYLATTDSPERYGLTIRMYVETLDELTEQLPEVAPMFQEWLGNRGHAATDFSLCVNVEKSLHESVGRQVSAAFSQGTLLAKLPGNLKVTLVIANQANDARVVTHLQTA